MMGQFNKFLSSKWIFMDLYTIETNSITTYHAHDIIQDDCSFRFKMNSKREFTITL